MPATWKSPREIAFIYNEEGVLVSVSVALVIATADGFEVRRGMREYLVDPEALGQEEVSPELVALGEAAIAQKLVELAVEPVE